MNSDRSWIWLALVAVAFGVWRFYLRPKLDKYNREKDKEDSEQL